MFELIIILALYGIVFLDIIEILYKCEHPHTGATPEGRLDLQGGS